MKEKSLLSEDWKCYDFVITANLRESSLLASKRYKDDLEKQKAERRNMEISLKRKAMVDKRETVKRRKQEMEQIVKEPRNNNITVNEAR